VKQQRHLIIIDKLYIYKIRVKRNIEKKFIFLKKYHFHAVRSAVQMITLLFNFDAEFLYF